MLDTSKRGFLYGTEKKPFWRLFVHTMKVRWFQNNTKEKTWDIFLKDLICVQQKVDIQVWNWDGVNVYMIFWRQDVPCNRSNGTSSLSHGPDIIPHTHTDWMNGLCQRLALGSALLSCAKTVYVILGEKKEAEHVPCQTFILSQACTQHIPGATELPLTSNIRDGHS